MPTHKSEDYKLYMNLLQLQSDKLTDPIISLPKYTVKLCIIYKKKFI